MVNEAWKMMEISKERFKKLSHFCSKYKKWESELYALESGDMPSIIFMKDRDHPYSNPTEKIVELKNQHETNMKIIRDACIEADPLLWFYLFISVTTVRSDGHIGLSYYVLHNYHSMPCTEDEWKGARRRFFYILDKKVGNKDAD